MSKCTWRLCVGCDGINSVCLHAEQSRTHWTGLAWTGLDRSVPRVKSSSARAKLSNSPSFPPASLPLLTPVHWGHWECADLLLLEQLSQPFAENYSKARIPKLRRTKVGNIFLPNFVAYFPFTSLAANSHPSHALSSSLCLFLSGSHSLSLSLLLCLSPSFHLSLCCALSTVRVRFAHC